MGLSVQDPALQCGTHENPCPTTDSIGAYLPDSCICPSGSYVKVNWTAFDLLDPLGVPKKRNENSDLDALLRDNSNLVPAIISGSVSVSMGGGGVSISNSTMMASPSNTNATTSAPTAVVVPTTTGAQQQLLTNLINNPHYQYMQNMVCAACPSESISCDWTPNDFDSQRESLGSAKPGFMVLGSTVSEQNTRDAYKCLTLEACPGPTRIVRGAESTCPEGSGGIACASCSRGYFYDNKSQKCQACGSSVFELWLEFEFSLFWTILILMIMN